MSRLRRALGIAGLGIAALAAARLLAWRAVHKFESLSPDTAGAPGAFIEIDGVRLHYIDAGSGPPVLLIHGWNGSTFDYRYTIAALSERYRVIAVDLKGYGFSERVGSGDYSSAAQGDLVAHLMDALKIEQATIAGHSMGGGVAQALAVRHPQRVECLILVDSVTQQEFKRFRGGRLVAPLLPLIAVFALRPSFMERALRFNVHDPEILTPDVKEGHFRPLRVKGHLRAQQLQMKSRGRDTAVDPRSIHQQALLLWGEHDRVIPLARGKELAQLLPNARLVVVPSAGHLPLEEQPAFCNREILGFLQEQASPAAEWSVAAEPAEAAT